MRLKSMELQGFKSFVDKTEITFEDGITAVVGPNGSGKSNISDALRWVLGEQSAKTLRGSKMGDVIFSGTEKRNPVGFCKVTLLFENDDRWLNIESSEVSVTRKYYKSGESEYYINGSQCRLKDLLELFRDTGVGKEGYSIIGQGQITEILSSNAAERRTAFEAATGILKYKSRKSEAQSRLVKTGDNIDRLNDLLQEITANMESLEEQSIKAKEYISCKEQLKEFELAGFIYRIQQSKSKAEKLENEAKELEKSISDLYSFEESLKRKKAELSENIRIESEREQKLKDDYILLREEILKTDSKKELVLERIKTVNENINSTNAQNVDLSKDISELTQRLSEYEAGFESAKNELADLKESFEQKNAEHEKVKEELNVKQEKLDDLKQQRILFLNSVSEVKINSSKYNAMLESIEKRLLDIDGQKEDILQRTKGFESEKAAHTDRLKTLTDEKEQAEKVKRSLLEKENELQSQKNDAISAVHTDEVKIGSVTSKLNLLKNMQKDYEGYNFAVKNLFKYAENKPNIKQLILGTVADIIDVKSEYVTAVETALGGSLQNIVTKTEEDAKKLIEVLKANGLGRATFLPVSGVRQSFLSREELSSIESTAGVIGYGEELVGFDEFFKPVVAKLLGRTVLVDNLDTAIALMRKNSFRFQTVTIDGEIIHAGGAMSGGSRGKKSTGILGRNDEIAALEKELKDIEHRAKTYDERLAVFDGSIKEVQSRFAENKQKLKGIYDSIDEVQNEISIVDAQLANENEKLVALNEEKEQLSDNMADIKERLSLVSDDEKTGSLAVDESEIESISKEVADLRIGNDKAYEEISAMVAKISGLEKDILAFTRDINRGKDELESKNKLLSSNTNLLNKLESDLKELNETAGESLKADDETLTAEKNLKQAIDEQEGKLLKLHSELEENERSAETARENITQSTDRKYKIDIERGKLSVETEMLENDIFERYDLSFDDVLKMELGIKPASYKKEINSLRETIKDMGNVNLNSIDEYAFTRSRYDQITAQLNDLTDSKRDLEELIEMLQRDMTVQFKEQFKLINANFEKIFKNLFGGGKAELIINKNESVLESDIEIVAQPPGKKLQSISLLSGGEKALTAIAILFAMLELKPTPFCVLDEIESALDEANVHGFAVYLKNYSEKTQFLVITHRRGVMELSDAIYGVAMQEKGVSKVVSMKLPEKD